MFIQLFISIASFLVVVYASDLNRAAAKPRILNSMRQFVGHNTTSNL